MPTIDAVDRARRRGRSGAPVNAPADQWQPSGTDEALAVMDRIARYCEYTCEPETGQCVEDDCEAWRLERAAATHVAQRWIDGEG